MYICLLYIHIGAIWVEIPFLCACLWDKWHDRDGLLRNIFSDMYLGMGIINSHIAFVCSQSLVHNVFPSLLFRN